MDTYIDQDAQDYFRTPRELEAIEKEKEDTKLEAQALILAYIRLFQTDDGKKVLDNLSEVCYVNKECFHAGTEDFTSYLLGKRSVVLHIQEQMKRAVS